MRHHVHQKYTVKKEGTLIKILLSLKLIKFFLPTI